MRVWLLALMMIPFAASEYGAEENGWPVGADGFSHDPAVRFDPAALAAWAGEVAHDAPLGPLNTAGPATIYPYYPIAVAEIQRLAELHPDIVRLHSAGKSTAQLDLWMLEIGNFADDGTDDFVAWQEREVIWIDGGTHSNEYSGVYFVLAVAQFLIEGYGDDPLATFVVDNRHTWIMPMVNPDGSHAMGRLNANLVNINRNYPVIWGGEGTDMLLNNPGPAAGSEVETQINIDWFNKTRPDYYASIHCCGNLWLFPYGEDGYDPADVDMMNRVCDQAFPVEIQEACGPIWSTIYPASGSSVDTAYEYTGAVSFGFEMSGRSNLAGPWGEPVTFAEVFEQEAESWQGIKHAFEHVERYGAHLVIDGIEADDVGLRLTIRNDGLGNFTGGRIAYRGESALEVLEFGHADVGPLGMGEATTAYLNGAQAGGDHRFELEYPKRLWETTNVRFESIPVQAQPGHSVAFVDGAWQVPLNPQAQAPAVVDHVDVPSTPLWGGLLVLAAVGLLRRRRA